MKKPYVPPEIEIRRVVVRECISTSDTIVDDTGIPNGISVIADTAITENEP